MSSDVSLHVLYKIANAPIQHYPYPHIYVEDVFPRDFYGQLLSRIPPKEAFKTLKALQRVSAGYPDTRFVLPLTQAELAATAEPFRGFWGGVASWLVGSAFGPALLSRFGTYLEQRFGDPGARRFFDEALLVQDYTTYSLGPHTDTPAKVLSLLFYLPADASRPHLGTSIYVPKDPKFLCKGGPHHPFTLFDRMVTMPYLPNTMFAFLKCDNAFHGVEPITDTDTRRDLLLYDIKVTDPSPPKRQSTAAPSGVTTPAHFSF